MRRAILFVFSSALLGGGTYLLWLQLRCMLGWADGTCYVMGRALLAGAFLIALGGYLLWDDITPRRL